MSRSVAVTSSPGLAFVVERLTDGPETQAHAVAALAAIEFDAGRALPPEQALPVYLRDKVALTLVEQRAR